MSTFQVKLGLRKRREEEERMQLIELFANVLGVGFLIFLVYWAALRLGVWWLGL